jgi:hypothetical protein
MARTARDVNAMAVVLEQALQALVEVLRVRPDLAAAVASVLQPPAGGEAPPRKIFMTVSEYAAHVGFSKRTIENLIGRGLPLSGSGRLRRVPVVEADAWLREGRAEDALERRARLDARRSAVSRLKTR